jgi:hypothetical protein
MPIILLPLLILDLYTISTHSIGWWQECGIKPYNDKRKTLPPNSNWISYAMQPTMITSSLFRYYRPEPENFDALKHPYIYLFNPIKFKGATEMQFAIDLSNVSELKKYIRIEIQRSKDLPKESDEFTEYSLLRIQKLEEHGKLYTLALDKDVEQLTEIIYEEIVADQKIGTRKGLLRNNFFNKTGVASFTTDINTLHEQDEVHWSSFASYGTGFCVEYDWSVLMDYFSKEGKAMRGDNVSYYGKDGAPKIILSNSYSGAVMDNYCSIIFSLGESNLVNEKEFRLAKVFVENIDDNDEQRKIVIPAKAIKAVYAGHRIKSTDLDQLKTIISTLNPPPTLYIMKDAGDTLVPISADE